MVKSNKGRRLSRTIVEIWKNPNRTTKDTKDYEEFDGRLRQQEGLCQL